MAPLEATADKAATDVPREPSIEGEQPAQPGEETQAEIQQHCAEAASARHDGSHTAHFSPCPIPMEVMVGDRQLPLFLGYVKL